MVFHLKRNLIIFATLLLILQVTKGQDDPPTESEEDDSSSEETVEDSNESRKRRRRRSVEIPDEPIGSSKDKNGNPSRAIPGLPDPETIVKIAEILTTVGEQVIPILISGNSAAPEFISKRILRDMKFLKNFKTEIDVLTENLKKKK